MNNLKCILLCAGYATRLYPLTENQPKALLSVGNKAIIDHILENVGRVHAVDQIYLVTNDRFYKHFNNWINNTYKAKKPVEIINDHTKTNADRLGAIGDVKYIVDKKKIKDNVMVIAGDNLFDFSLSTFYNYFKEKKSNLVAVHDIKEKTKAAKKYGVISLNKDNKIVEFEEKPEYPKTSLVSTGCYIFTKSAIQKINEYIKSHRVDNPGDFLKWLMQKEHIYGYKFSENWFDIGSFEALEEAYNAYVRK
ncbi:nucleotidyltransferase family protein [Candidatus Woesearchaeota archaeon]|nr:nucleotidyltransferase family protein [Candidatus Woesearchaeota archaeon]